MRTPALVFALAAAFFFPSFVRSAAAPAPDKPTPDARSSEAAPRGKLTGPHVWRAKAYRGTSRHYWIYVPAQHRPLKPACVMVFQDGQQYLREDGPFRTTQVLDELIHRKEMPVTIALFVNPGFEDDETPPDIGKWETRNRAAEYGSTSDKYVRFLIEEFVPGALKGLNITKNAAGHAIVGTGEGGVCAFTAAWHRPEYFQKVISHDGRFAAGDGSNLYADKVRAAVRKPIRFALQDVSFANSSPGPGGASPTRLLADALSEKKYDLHYETMRASESSSVAAFLKSSVALADQLRWLWRDFLQDPPSMEELSAKAPADAPFGTPGTTWELAFGGMSEPVTYEFRANNVLWWVEYQIADNYELRDGKLLTTSPSDPTGRYRTWEINGNRFARTIHNTGPDVELGLTARGTLKRVQ